MKFICFIFILFYCISIQAQTCVCPAIDSNATINFACKGGLQVNGKINDSSVVNLSSDDGDIVINGPIDLYSNVIITAKRGSVTIKQNIDRFAKVKIICRGDIIIQGRIDGGANCDFNTERGKITVTDKVANTSTVIKYHSVQPPSWGTSIAINAQGY